MGAKRNEPVGQWISQLAYAGSFLFGSFPAHKYHTQPHPPLQHHQGSSTAVDYSSHFFRFFEGPEGGRAWARMEAIPQLASPLASISSTPRRALFLPITR